MSSNILPLGIKNRTKTELPALIALEAIGQNWFNENHRCDLMSIALVAQLLTKAGNEIYTASSELIALLGADELDITQIRPVVILLSSWMQRQPNGRIQFAIDRLLGVPVKKVRRRAYA